MGGAEPDHASAASVAGLAREVEELRRGLEPLRELPSRLDEVTGVLTQVVEAQEASARRSGRVSVVSWLDLEEDPEAARAVLAELVDWVRAVYLRYPDGHRSLQACWLWHPSVVEELLWLRAAWRAAYRDGGGSVQLVGDWHDRLRPGVVRRVHPVLSFCHLPAHCEPIVTPVMPLGEDVTTVIADWWALDRDQPAPDPTPEQLSAARDFEDAEMRADRHLVRNRPDRNHLHR